jgi:hypothetical protein
MEIKTCMAERSIPNLQATSKKTAIPSNPKDKTLRPETLDELPAI